MNINLDGVTLGQIVVALAFLMSLSKGIDWIMTPIKNRNAKDQNVDERIKTLEENRNTDNQRLNQLEKDTKEILLSLNELLNHSIDNNHIDQLKKRKADLDAYLINR